jgi:hypothetical protein
VGSAFSVDPPGATCGVKMSLYAGGFRRYASIMREVSDAFLLNMAEVSATLIGLFLVGVFFYVETGLRRADQARKVFEPYLRAGTRITLIVFAIPLGLSLTLVALETFWARVLFALLSLVLLAANVDSALRIRGVARVTGSTALLVNEVVGSVVVVLLVVMPWVLGGLRPTREDLTWAILLSFAAGFLSISATVMSAFDIARLEASARTVRTIRRSVERM